VLALASELGLSADQKQRTESLFKSMETKAISLGRPLVEEERKLDQLFAEKKITPESLDQSLTRIGELQAQVRGAHLEAHLAQAEILTPAQVSKYMTLRGYSNAQGTEGHAGHKHG
jgi:Spy/CpxP family protein refolding chaperone